MSNSRTAQSCAPHARTASSAAIAKPTSPPTRATSSAYRPAALRIGDTLYEGTAPVRGGAAVSCRALRPGALKDTRKQTAQRRAPAARRGRPVQLFYVPPAGASRSSASSAPCSSTSSSAACKPSTTWRPPWTPRPTPPRDGPPIRPGRCPIREESRIARRTAAAAASCSSARRSTSSTSSASTRQWNCSRKARPSRLLIANC